VVATRRLAKPRPVQDEQAPLRGGPPRSRVAAQKDGHPRQNPAYRPATEKALETGLFLLALIYRGLVRLTTAAGRTSGRFGFRVTPPTTCCGLTTWSGLAEQLGQSN